jgi:3-oxoacyl-[acyl-carrier protein] reductase
MEFNYRRLAEIRGVPEEEVRRSFLSEVPMGRTGTREEIAALVGFLASPRAGWITGQEIFINGGWIMP